MISQAETATAPSALTKSPTPILSQQLEQVLSPPLQLSMSPSNIKHKQPQDNNHKHQHHNHPSSKSHSNPQPPDSLHDNTNSGSNNINSSVKKSPSIKKRKRFEETIIDGFSIIAFKTWEDLQDELNERSSSLNTPKTTTTTTTTAAAADSASGNSYDHNVVKKANSKSRHKKGPSASKTKTASTDNLLDHANKPVTNSNGSTAFNNASVATTTSSHHHHKDGAVKKKKKDKTRVSPSRSPEPKEKRNKTSSSSSSSTAATTDKTTLKKALEAKELAEKRLSILQKKLEQEQNKNRSSGHIDDSSNQDHHSQKTIPIVPESRHYPSTPMLRKDDSVITSSNANNSTGQHQDHQMSKDQISYLNSPKPALYSPFHINSHLQHKSTIPMMYQSTHTPPPMFHPSAAMHNINQNSHLSPQKPTTHHIPPPTANLLQPPSQNHRTTPPPQSTPIKRDPYQHPPATPPISAQSSSYPQRPPHLYTQSQSAAPPHHHHHHPMMAPQHNPYSSQPASAMMSSMDLNPLASPYSCPQICITDTISRQTSIIPTLGAALEQSTSQTSTRYGHHPGMIAHPSSHLNPSAGHHPMLYPMPQTPTERSFMEFVRSYPAPNHMGYPSLMNTLIPPPSASSLQAASLAAHGPAPPTPLHQAPHLTSAPPFTVPPNFTANAYGFDRSWPRLALDNQRAAAAAAANRYNSFYQAAAAANPMPDRPYASYASGRPPPFHAGLFQPPF